LSEGLNYLPASCKRHVGCHFLGQSELWLYIDWLRCANCITDEALTPRVKKAVCLTTALMWTWLTGFWLNTDYK